MCMVFWPIFASFFIWLLSGRSFRKPDNSKLWIMSVAATGFEFLLIIAAVLYGKEIGQDPDIP